MQSRYASARDALRAGAAVVVSGIGAVGIVTLTQGPLGDFSRSVFVIDALICAAAITQPPCHPWIDVSTVDLDPLSVGT